jgi:tRNA A58 N-methylase Trm61
LLLKWHDIYSNADVLSPIDKKTWHGLGETAQLDRNSRVIELASGKGALALYLAEKFGCHVDAYEINSAFVECAMEKSKKTVFSQELISSKLMSTR